MGEAPPTPTTTPAAAAGTAGKAQQAIAPAEKSDMSQYLPALLALGAAGGAGKSYQEAQPPQYPENFNEPLPRYALNRRRMNPMSASSYYTYGQPGAPESGQHLFLDPDPFAGEEVGGLAAATGAGAVGGGSIILPPGDVGAQQRQALERQGWSFNPTTNEMVPPQKAPQTAAHGAYVRGPGTGRSDDIDAKLSDGEYIVDAETVSLLGDGSGSAGARRLDEMRRNLRQHKAANLKKGEFTHKAKMPMKYMGGMNRLRRSQIAAGRA
jgi:hypothetical protein